MLNPWAVEALKAWLEVRPGSEDPVIFLNGDGERLSVRSIQKMLAKLRAEARLVAPLHPHAIRHAHATALLRAGVSTEIIRTSLNHESLATTQRYLHGDEALLREALARLPALGENGQKSPDEI